MNACICAHVQLHLKGDSATHPIGWRWNARAALLLLAGMSPQRRRALAAILISLPVCGLRPDAKPVRSLNLETAVGRTREGGDGTRWQGATTLRAHAREEEQRGQRDPAQPSRVRSAVALR